MSTTSAAETSECETVAYNGARPITAKRFHQRSRIPIVAPLQPKTKNGCLTNANSKTTDQEDMIHAESPWDETFNTITTMVNNH